MTDTQLIKHLEGHKMVLESSAKGTERSSVVTENHIKCRPVSTLSIVCVFYTLPMYHHDLFFSLCITTRCNILTATYLCDEVIMAKAGEIAYEWPPAAH